MAKPRTVVELEFSWHRDWEKRTRPARKKLTRQASAYLDQFVIKKTNQATLKLKNDDYRRAERELKAAEKEINAELALLPTLSDVAIELRHDRLERDHNSFIESLVQS